MSPTGLNKPIIENDCTNNLSFFFLFFCFFLLFFCVCMCGQWGPFSKI